MKNGDKNKNKIRRFAVRLLEEYLTREPCKKPKLKRMIEYGSRRRGSPPMSWRSSSELKWWRFGGKKGDLSRAVEEAVKTWITKKD